MKMQEKGNIILKTINQINAADKTAFLSAAIIGFITHMYVYTNLYLGHDASLLYNYNRNLDIVTGRYLGTFLKYSHNFLQTPLLIGLISLIFLGFSSAVICRILKIKDKPFLIIISAFIVTWPVITSINCYIFAADLFSFAIFTACLSAYFTDKYKFGFIAGIPLLVLSMASYQSYWGTCATLLIFCIVRNIIIDKSTDKETIMKCLRFAATLLIGFIIYYFLWNFIVAAAGKSMIDYLGMDNMGYSSVTELFQNLISTYRTVFVFFFKPNAQSYYPVYLMLAGIVSVITAMSLIFLSVVNKKLYKQPVKLSILIFCFLVMPIAINCVELMSKGASLTLLGRFAYLFPFLLLPMLLSQFENNFFVKYLVLCKRAAIIVLVLSCLNGIYGANATYLKLESNYHIAISQVTQYMSRITAEEGYETTTPVVFIGGAKGYKKPGFEWCNNVTGAWDTGLSFESPIRNIFLLFNPEVNWVYDKSQYLNLEEVQNLKSFPANDCVVWVDGVLVFKLS
jgi:hypothetical protein